LSDNIVISDLANESLVVGYIYRRPDTLNEYMELISPEYDFTDSGLCFLYRLLVDTFLNHDIVNETSLNIQVSKMDDESQTLYKKMGGFKVYQRLGNVSQVEENFKKIYEKLKVYNLLRELQRKGFNVEKHLDKLKDRSPDAILKSYEMQLSKVGSYIKGIQDSVQIGQGMLNFYENLKKEPDIGIEIPFPIVNRLARGWRTSKIYASGMHSGMGKSREVAYMLTFTSIIGQEPVLIGVNEQDEEEWRLMLLTSVANNILAPKYGLYVDEDEIALGQCTGKKDEMVKEAAKFMEERSKISFLEMNVYDFDSLKIILKKHKLRGIKHAVIDTFKPFRGEAQGMADWLAFVVTSEKLKRIIGSEKKGGLDMGLWITCQLTDESLISKILGSSSIASGKQIKHNLDFLKMSRMLDWKDKEKIKVKLEMPDNPFNGQIQSLDKYKDYYLTLVDKNRGGKDHKYIIYEVDKGKVIFRELGWAVFNSDEAEKEFMEKES
jgi:replicative DNA helicase